MEWKTLDEIQKDEKMPSMPSEESIYDLFIIGGGVNGCGIARDAAGRGLKVALAEMDDLGSATSSASTKLFHGGLRYLEYLKVRLVREALIEREVLLSAMPHISWPMRFVLPYHQDQRFEGETPTSRLMTIFMPWMKGRRPAWLIRMGLFFYDHLGGRHILPGTTTVDLASDPVGAPLQDRFKCAFEYSDCWVEDSRLVVLNARDAEARGAKIMTRTEVTTAERVEGLWEITVRHLLGVDNDGQETFYTRLLVNASGPWVEHTFRDVTHISTPEGVRLVRGSHIVTKKLFDHGKCYFFQGKDGRIIFAIPYETDFTLIGTTEVDHEDPLIKPVCTPEEEEYLCGFLSKYLKKPIRRDDIVWTYSGVRPLYNDGVSSATAATRDYVLKVDVAGGAPLLNIFGGKITTYRRLAEHALERVSGFFPQISGASVPWTARVALPGGDFPVNGFEAIVSKAKSDYAFLDDFWARRLARAYGTEINDILGSTVKASDLGQAFGATLTEREVLWLIDREYARTAEDVVWRRSKLGLRLNEEEVARLDAWMTDRKHRSS